MKPGEQKVIDDLFIHSIIVSPNGHTVYMIPKFISPPKYVNYIGCGSPFEKIMKYRFYTRRSDEPSYIWAVDNSFGEDIAYLTTLPKNDVPKLPPDPRDNDDKNLDLYTRSANITGICDCENGEAFIALPHAVFLEKIKEKTPIRPGTNSDYHFGIPALENISFLPKIQIIQNVKTYHSPTQSRLTDKQNYKYGTRPLSLTMNSPTSFAPRAISNGSAVKSLDTEALPDSAEDRYNTISNQPKIDADGVLTSTDARPNTVSLKLGKPNGSITEYRIPGDYQQRIIKNLRDRLANSGINIPPFELNPDIANDNRMSKTYHEDIPRNRAGEQTYYDFEDTELEPLSITESPVSRKNLNASHVSFGPSLKSTSTTPAKKPGLRSKQNRKYRIKRKVRVAARPSAKKPLSANSHPKIESAFNDGEFDIEMADIPE